MPQRLDIPRPVGMSSCSSGGRQPVERCLACEAEGVATRGALPRLRGRGEQGRRRPGISIGCTFGRVEAPQIAI
jgi:hypothetical protein